MLTPVFLLFSHIQVYSIKDAVTTLRMPVIRTVVSETLVSKLRIVSCAKTCFASMLHLKMTCNLFQADYCRVRQAVPCNVYVVI